MTLSKKDLLIPHEIHGDHVTGTRAYRWFVLKQNLRFGGGWLLARLALVLLALGALAAGLVGAGYLWRLGR